MSCIRVHESLYMRGAAKGKRCVAQRSRSATAFVGCGSNITCCNRCSKIMRTYTIVTIRRSSHPNHSIRVIQIHACDAARLLRDLESSIGYTRHLVTWSRRDPHHDESREPPADGNGEVAPRYPVSEASRRKSRRFYR